MAWPACSAFLRQESGSNPCRHVEAIRRRRQFRDEQDRSQHPLLDVAPFRRISAASARRRCHVPASAWPCACSDRPEWRRQEHHDQYDQRRPDAKFGTHRLSWQRNRRAESHGICRRGIGRTFQNLRLFAGLSVLENVLLGQHCRMKNGFWVVVLRYRNSPGRGGRERDRASAILDILGLRELAQVAGR